jgi:hypothetical protein
MKPQIAVCLLSLALLPACSTTSQTTAEHQTLEQRLNAKYASADTGATAPGEEAAPPAEGPEDIPAEAPTSPLRNPSLVPTPSLRVSAASSTP